MIRFFYSIKYQSNCKTGKNDLMSENNGFEHGNKQLALGAVLLTFDCSSGASGRFKALSESGLWTCFDPNHLLKYLNV